MKSFAESVIQPFIREMRYTRLCEIGAQFGENTGRLLELGSVHVTVIDPCLDADLCAKTARESRVAMHKGLSLAVLPKLIGRYDCILIDGDHNWYTVYHELQTIHGRGLLRPGGTALLHDVSWPYGRRDMYFQPETIPEECRQPYAAQGIVRGMQALAEAGGVNGQMCNALMEGGPRNGVLTAVEDFLRDHEDEYDFFRIDVQFGLGFLYRRGKPVEDAAFERYRRRLQRRLRVGAVKDFAARRVPALYAWLRRLRDALLR